MANNPFSNISAGITGSLGGSTTPKKKFMSLQAQGTNPQALAPNSTSSTGRATFSPITANTGATSTQSPSVSAPAQQTTQNPALTTPAAKTFISNQMPSTQTPTVQPEAQKTGTPTVTGGETINQPKADPYRDAMTAYVQSLSPSKEETESRKYLSSLLDTSRREEEKALESGETLGFASGEAARVNKNRAFDILAAQGGLEALTGQRKATTEGQKARLDYEKSLVPEEKSINEKYGSGAIGEYNFAKEQGYKGSFADYQNEDANRKAKATGGGQDLNALLSVTEAQALGVPYGTTRAQALGSSVTGKPTAEQSKARQFAVSADNANNVLGTLGYTPGNIEVPLPNLLKGSDRQQFEQASRAFVNATLRRESGATITDDEFKNKYRELIPQAGDGQKVMEQKALARAAAVKSIQEAGGDVAQSGNADPLGLGI